MQVKGSNLVPIKVQTKKWVGEKVSGLEIEIMVESFGSLKITIILIKNKKRRAKGHARHHQEEEMELKELKEEG